MTTENTKQKKHLDSKTKKIIDIVITTLEAIVVVLCIVFSIIIWTGAAGNPEDRSINWFAILTDSMVKNSELDYDALGYDDKLCFNPGDMVITKRVKATDIKVGDVVAFKGSVTDSKGNTSVQIITHRVIEILDSGAYRIAGDKDNNRQEVVVVSYDAVIGKMTGKLKGVGGAILWLQGYRKVDLSDGGCEYKYSGSSVSFLIIIIPLAVLLIYNGYYVITWAMSEKVKKAADKARLEAVQAQAQASIDSEAIRKEALRAMMQANGMTDEQIEAYFKSKEKSNEVSTTVETESSDVEPIVSSETTVVPTETTPDEEPTDDTAE